MPTDPATEKHLDKTEASELSFLSGGGEMAERMRAFDWSTSPVGPPAQWPQSLKTAVSICIGSRYPIVLWWGNPAYTMFYNDGYVPVLGVTKHPGWLGRSGRECWKELWSTVGPMLEGVFETGVATWSEDLLLVMERNLPREEVYFTFSYSPIHGDGGGIDGIFCACYETTERVIGERRLQTLRDLGRTVMEVKSAEEACEVAVETLAGNTYDVPFALIYLLDDQAHQARLLAATGLEAGSVAAPTLISMSESTASAGWPFSGVLETSTGEIVSDLSTRFGTLPGGAWPESPEKALILPITASGYTKATGFLVAGFSPRRVVDSEYRSFFEMITGHVGTAITNARAFQEERKRAEALAEIDRAKTEFFSSVSHEFRTPLTLMLGPLEEVLSQDGLPPRVHDRLEVAYRNSVRLLKLVNTLLDFSRLEAGRIEAVYEEVDLAAAHLPVERLGAERKLASTSLHGGAYVEEALKWLPGSSDFESPESFADSSPALVTSSSEQSRARILLADDNADMRDYLRRLLVPTYEVEAVADGETALGLARCQHFDLVLSDVMLPKLDGFGLLKALRADDRTQSIPVILLSARAGEESCVEGMGAGADDYLVKPFSARELLARVEAHLNLYRVRREAEESLMQLMVAEQKARADAEMANRVKDEFLAMLSHELRTPLNAIIGWSHLLKKGQLKELDRQRGIDVIDRNAEAQRAIIDELLDVSRIVSGKLKLEKQPVELAGVISAAIDSVRPAAEAKGIEIVTSIDRDAGPVSGEAVRLQQVIWNLLSNAVKFTPQGGSVRVELNVVGEKQEVVISDTGEGIDSEFLPSIFERFRRADSSTRRMHGGLGLGLSIVRSLVQMHDGEIRAASDGKGKGSVFTLTLPAISDEKERPVESLEAQARLPNLTWKPYEISENGFAAELKPDLLSGLKVLTVDDQPDTRELIVLALGRYGAEVRASDSASKALQMIREWRPHVVVSDIGLPEMDGYDFLRQLRELEGDGERIPAIAVTGYAGAMDESKALDAGYEIHFSKPIQLSELALAIAKVSRRTPNT